MRYCCYFGAYAFFAKNASNHTYFSLRTSSVPSIGSAHKIQNRLWAKRGKHGLASLASRRKVNACETSTPPLLITSAKHTQRAPQVGVPPAPQTSLLFPQSNVRMILHFAKQGPRSLAARPGRKALLQKGRQRDVHGGPGARKQSVLREVREEAPESSGISLLKQRQGQAAGRFNAAGAGLRLSPHQRCRAAPPPSTKACP